MTIIRNTKTDPNKFLPIRYNWAREYYKTGVANNWTPEEIPMQDDVEMWKSDALTKEERRLILWNLGFFSTAESLTANNIILAVYSHVTDPACRQYLLRQGYEEAIHSDTFVYCCDSLGLDPEEIYTMYQTIPSIKKKDDFVIELTKTIFDKKFEIKTKSDIQAFLKDLIGYYVIMEGIFFYAGFAMMLALKRQKKMIGIGEQFEFILRDESTHLAFGVDLINTIRQENPGVWDKNLEKEVQTLISQAVCLEQEYAHDACPQGLLGINADQFSTYVEYIADRRLERLGMPKHYDVSNPFPWMSQSVDLVKEKNFFETRVTEYQVGGLNWD
jgi:ribonucleoside-diphosphate reductase beta chain